MPPGVLLFGVGPIQSTGYAQGRPNPSPEDFIGPSPVWFLLFVAAYFAADFFVGTYHMLTDKGWNIRRQVIAFREHHDGAVVVDLKPVFFALPVIAVALYLRLPFVFGFAFFAGLSEFAHYGAHRPRSCPWFMRKLQQAHVIISPAAHAKHHDGSFDRSYCVLSGWANWLVDRLARFIPVRSTCQDHAANP